MYLEFKAAPLSKLAGAFPKAGARALNKMAAQAKTEASKQIRARYNIKKRDLDKNIWLRKASERNLQSELIPMGRGIPLYDFSPEPTSRGISVMIVKGTRTVKQGTFIATMPSGHTGVFQRINERDVDPKKHGLPIGHLKPKPGASELTGPSPRSMLGNNKVMDLMTRFVREKLRPILLHEINFFKSRR